MPSTEPPRQLFIVVDPVAAGQEGEDREERNDDHEHPGERRRIPHTEIAERFLIEIEGVKQRRIDRPARAEANSILQRR